MARTLGQDLAAALRFYSRLPLPARDDTAFAPPDINRIAYAVPLAGAVLGLIGALVLILAMAVKLPAFLAAVLSVAVLALATGCFHEDGLADTADGLGGGRDRAHKLAIMRDSRIGTYGALALGLSLMLRASLIAMILDRSGAWAAAATVLVAAPWSRAEGLFMLATQPAARNSGAAAAVGQPTVLTARIALGLSLFFATGIGLAAPLPIAGLLIGCALAHGAAAVLSRMARRLIGGQTGDILGAAQQLAEIAIYLGLALAIAWAGR